MGTAGSVSRRSVVQLTGAALVFPAALFQSNNLENRRMAFTPKFVDLVRNFTTTVGTGDFALGPAVNGFTGFAAALQPGDQFYYSTIGIDHPNEREVGRGTLNADGTIGRDPIGGTLTAFTDGTKAIALIAAAEWFTLMQAGGGGSAGGTPVAVSKAALAAAPATQGPTMLTEPGSEGLFVFDGSDLSAKVSADTRQGIHVAPASAATGASGAWVRAERDTINVLWFMSPAEVADVRGFTYALNVTDALRAASSYVQDQSGGTLLFPKGGYLVGQQTFQGTLLDGVTPVAYGPEEIVTIKNATRPVVLSGYGAVLKAADGLHYGSFDPVTGLRYEPTSMPFLDFAYYGYPYRALINIEGNASVIVEGFELDGNNTKLVLGGYWGDSSWQLEGAGIWASRNDSLNFRDLNIHHQPLDGMVIAYAGLTENGRATPVKIENVRARFNGRQGLSFVGGKNLHIVNCDFSQTGQALNTVSAELVRSTPGAGIDFEAENSIIRDVLVENSIFLSNWGGGIAASSGDSRRVRIKGSKIESLTIGRPGYTIEDSMVIGFFDAGIAPTDLYTGLPAVAADGIAFRNVRFTYDPAFTENGTLVNPGQPRLVDFIYGRMKDVSIDTGSVPLPNLNVWGGSFEAQPVFQNVRMKSTASSAVNLYGRFQGYNYIDYGAQPGFQFGTRSRIETGDVIVNGVPQAPSAHLPDGDYGDLSFSAGGTIATVEAAHPVGGNFTVTAPAATDGAVILDRAPGQYGLLRFVSSGLARWTFGTNNDGEWGSANGSNFCVFAYDNNGAYMRTQMSMNRATGDIAFGGNLSVPGLASSGAITSSGGAIGYAAGAGGAVAQVTSKATPVTIDKAAGQITTHSEALAAGSLASFAVSNNAVAATDTVNLHLAGGNALAGTYRYWVEGIAPGTFTIVVENRSAGALAEALVFNFAVVKAVNA
jgi:hypothetical protein